MREILFRGKRTDNGEWVEGYFCDGGAILQGKAFILSKAYAAQVSEADRNEPLDGVAFGITEVHTDTVGQYTGLKDKHGRRIFEGDIVRTKYGRICKVVWFSSEQYSGWDFEPVSDKCDPPDRWDLFYARNLTVLGNIHDNPELIQATGADVGDAGQDVMMPAT